MTRINVGIPPRQLTNKHLIAEHREIKRIPNCVAKGKFNLKNVPAEFKLGTGHVSFFYDKLGYLRERYIQLYEECVGRGFNVTNYLEAWEGVPEYLMGNYTPTQRDIELIKERIAERLSGAPAGKIFAETADMTITFSKNK